MTIPNIGSLDPGTCDNQQQIAVPPFLSIQPTNPTKAPYPQSSDPTLHRELSLAYRFGRTRPGGVGRGMVSKLRTMNQKPLKTYRVTGVSLGK